MPLRPVQSMHAYLTYGRNCKFGIQHTCLGTRQLLEPSLPLRAHLYKKKDLLSRCAATHNIQRTSVRCVVTQAECSGRRQLTRSAATPRVSAPPTGWSCGRRSQRCPCWTPRGSQSWWWGQARCWRRPPRPWIGGAHSRQRRAPTAGQHSTLSEHGDLERLPNPPDAIQAVQGS